MAAVVSRFNRPHHTYDPTDPTTVDQCRRRACVGLYCGEGGYLVASRSVPDLRRPQTRAELSSYCIRLRKAMR